MPEVLADCCSPCADDETRMQSNASAELVTVSATTATATNSAKRCFIRFLPFRSGPRCRKRFRSPYWGELRHITPGHVKSEDPRLGQCSGMFPDAVPERQRQVGQQDVRPP